ncbi:hypothetical protein VTJ04DRAFT_3505 [Mycothermus thermophilus]|uniref:uncharacterized protein n=1 Tax=Humicola insolens TaxID=85995 RepID=UPI00374235B7
MAASKSSPPNYYAILEVSETASTKQIREAYKRAALKTHPDRLPQNHPDRASRTRRFQLVNDAYFVLADPARRREYDYHRRRFTPSSSGASTPSSSSSSRKKSDAASGGTMPGTFPSAEEAFAEAEAASAAAPGAGTFFSWAWDYFMRSQTGQNQQQEEQQRAREQTEEAQFSEIFEEMLREQGLAGDAANAAAAAGGSVATRNFWSLVGGLSGGALGFIVGNVPGMLAGAVAGNRLGAVRDTKGKSVYEVFQELPQSEKSKLLSQLAAKVLSHAAGI